MQYIHRGIIGLIFLALLVFVFFTYIFFFCRVDFLPKDGRRHPKTGIDALGGGNHAGIGSQWVPGIWEETARAGTPLPLSLCGIDLVFVRYLRHSSIPVGQIGIVTARGGKPLPPERILAQRDEKGTLAQVLGARLAFA
jgi:hypothetical protein